MIINTSLLREKFSIRTDGIEAVDPALKMPAQSNRMPIKLQSGNLDPEEYVVRAHNMHSCARMVASMIQDYDRGGPLLNRNIAYKWEEVWSDVVSGYELAYNPDRWICVYHDGIPVYEFGKRHPFLDIVEKCDFINGGDYDSSLKIAEDIFKKAGKTSGIGYESNVAIILSLDKMKGRCGLIFRCADRTTTFNYQIEATKSRPINPSQCLRTAAALLEGIQISFMVGLNNEKIRLELIDPHSPEMRQTREARKRLIQLNGEITALETNYKVRYRPERPDFNRVIAESEKAAYKFIGENI